MVNICELEDMLTDCKFVHPWKVKSFIERTLSGIETDVRLLHPVKAQEPILCTEVGM